MEHISVLIVDDHAVVRRGLRAFLESEGDIEVVGEAADGAEALQQVQELLPDVVLMDVVMPGMDGITATRKIHEVCPSSRVLILTSFSEDDKIFPSIKAGAQGYLLKDTRRDVLIDAIKGTAEGKTYLDPAIAGKLTQQVASGVKPPQPAEAPLDPFTEREHEVLNLLAQGHSNPEIANRLHLARGTVRNYVSAILQKLGVSDRTQAAVVAVQRGMVEPQED